MKRAEETKRHAFRDVMDNPPNRVKVVARKHGEDAARKMQIAIALDTSRRRMRRM